MAGGFPDEYCTNWWRRLHSAGGKLVNTLCASNVQYMFIDPRFGWYCLWSSKPSCTAFSIWFIFYSFTPQLSIHHHCHLRFIPYVFETIHHCPWAAAGFESATINYQDTVCNDCLLMNYSSQLLPKQTEGIQIGL